MNKQEEKSAQTKKALVAAFWQLYTKKPIEKISVKEITDITGVYRGTLYYYFADVYAILEYIETDILQDWEQLISEIFTEHRDVLLRGNVLELAPWVAPFKEKHGDVISVLLSPSGDPAFQQKIRDTLRAKLFSTLQIPASSLEAVLIFEACFSGSLTLLLRWYTDSTPFETIAAVAQKIMHPNLFQNLLHYSSNPLLRLI